MERRVCVLQEKWAGQEAKGCKLDLDDLCIGSARGSVTAVLPATVWSRWASVVMNLGDMELEHDSKPFTWLAASP